MQLINAMLAKTARLLNPERAHQAAIAYLQYAPLSASHHQPTAHQTNLAQIICGLNFPNPIGVAAGFDKNAQVANTLLARGFGAVEVGTITPLAQDGNPRPRLFRLAEQQALINRLGFNNDGHAGCIKRLQMQISQRPPAGIIGVNIGANKLSENRIADYVSGINAFQPYADYFAVNVSSPNTPGLRSLQSGHALGALTDAVLEARLKNAATMSRNPPVFVKIAPDLTEAELKAVASVALSSGIDGLIISNTTLRRPVPIGTRHNVEQGGFSGAPLFDMSTIILARMRQLVGPKMPLIGVGGINSAERAMAKIEAGANVVQLYTGMVYGGFGIAQTLCDDLAALIASQGMTNVSALTSTKTNEWAAKHIGG